MLKLFLITTFMHCCFGKVGKWDVFTTKTAYHWAHNVCEPEVDADYQKVDGYSVCTAAQVYMVLRHGARFPTDGSTQDIAELEALLMNITDGPYYQNILNWKSNYTAQNAELLCELGKEEQFDIGRRTGLRLKSLFTKYGQHLKFVSSTKERNSQSTRHFYKGLQNVTENIAKLDNMINKTLLRFYDGCTIYENEVEDSLEHMKEVLKYRKTNDFLHVAEKLTQDLGLPENISADTVELVFDLCAYDKYIFGEETFWCDLLSDEDRLIVGYADELATYYEHHGHPVITKMTCPLVSDLFSTMDMAINDTWDYSNSMDELAQGYVAGKFLDGHSTSVLLLMTTLGLFEERSPLVANHRDENRVFKSSDIASYSANVEFVLYACRENQDNAKNAFKVKMFVNENAMIIPGCNTMLCPYETLREKFKDLINNCDLQRICSEQPPGSSGIVG